MDEIKITAMKNTTAIGNRAETLTCEYLVKNGYEIVDRNYRDRYCEIDIIAKNSEYICFVEVKYRNTEAFGGGLGAVNAGKQTRLKRSAEYWLADNQEYEKLQPRIDVIAVDADKNVEIIENAVF